MRSPVGRQCSLTDQRIISELDGRFCERCGVAFHTDALSDDNDTCPTCRRRFADTAAEKRELKESNAHEVAGRQQLHKVRKLVFVSIGLCLLPALVAGVRFALGIDAREWDGTRRFGDSMDATGSSPLRWCWIASIGLYCWAVVVTCKERVVRAIPILLLGLIFVGIAGVAAYAHFVHIPDFKRRRGL